MAKLRRQIGIRHAQVQLPQSQSIGPALVKTAAAAGEIAFQRAADTRTQEAQVAAAALNFERDGDGNLLPPSLPIGDNGLLAPNIYDREYTQMVSQRYLQQINIDTAERLNVIATENMFDPSAYRKVAEAYVAKVTELAPDMLKADVNAKAQMRMVEHFNRIIREKGEKDHKEAAKIQSITIDRLYDDAAGYAFGGNDAATSGVAVEVFANIAQGIEFNYWDAGDAAAMVHEKQAQIAMNYMAGDVSRLAADPLKHAEAIERYAAFARGEGKVKTVDVDGSIINVDVTDQFPNNEDREALASQGIQLIKFKEQARSTYEDAIFDAGSDRFFDWWENHMVTALGNGTPIDMGRLFAEHKKADQAGNDPLRRAIGVIIQSQYGKGGSASKWEQNFEAGFRDWTKQYNKVRTEIDGNAPATTEEELLRNHQATLDAVGNIPNGNVQTGPAAEDIGKFYSVISGTNLDYEFFANADLNDIKFIADNYMALVGIWPDELVEYIAGNLQDPEGMNQETLDRVLSVTRTFWNHPEFRNNMLATSALGDELGGTLEHLMRRPKQQASPGYVNDVLKKFNTPGFSIYEDWTRRPDEEKQEFLEIAASEIEKHFETSWKQFRIERGVQAQTSLHPRELLRRDVDAVPGILLDQIETELAYHAPFINTRDPDSFKPYVKKATVAVMERNGYAASALGYSEFRHAGDYGKWTRPKTGIVQNAPEFYLRDSNGDIDYKLVEMATDDFQAVLDVYQKSMPKGTPRFIAGDNAATVYNSELSRLNNYPTYNVVLIDTNGRYRVLLEDSLYGGQPYPLDFESAKQRRGKTRHNELKQVPFATADSRLDYQNSFQDPRSPRNEPF